VGGKVKGGLERSSKELRDCLHVGGEGVRGGDSSVKLINILGEVGVTLLEGVLDRFRSREDDEFGRPVDKTSLEWGEYWVSVANSKEIGEGNALCPKVVEDGSVLTVVAVEPLHVMAGGDPDSVKSIKVTGEVEGEASLARARWSVEPKDNRGLSWITMGLS